MWDRCKGFISDSFSTYQCWQEQGGGRRIAVLAVTSVTIVDLPQETHAGQEKDKPRDALDQLHFAINERLNIWNAILCPITQRYLPRVLLSGSRKTFS